MPCPFFSNKMSDESCFHRDGFYQRRLDDVAKFHQAFQLGKDLPLEPDRMRPDNGALGATTGRALD